VPRLGGAPPGSPYDALAPALLALAEHIVDSKTGEFDPSTFRDRYEEALLKLAFDKVWASASLRGRQLGVVYPLRILLFDEIQLASATHQSAHVFAPNIARACLKSGDYPFFISFGEIEPRLETSFQKQLHAEPEHLRHLLDVVSDLQELLGLPGSELLDVPQTLDRAQKVNFPVREFAQWER
jgi:hypothetical protein